MITRRQFMCGAAGVCCVSILDAGWKHAAAMSPPRIVSLDDFFSEMLVAMHQPPVAMTMRNGAPPPHLVQYLGELKSAGLHSAPDYEAIVSVQPDLIVGQAARFYAEEPLLRAIAPTLLLNEPSGDWRPFMKNFAVRLQLVDAARAAILDHDAKVADLRNRITDRAGSQRVLILRIRQRDIRVYGTLRRSGPVLYDDLGLRPHQLTPKDKANTTISPEVIPYLDADRIFLMAEDERRTSRIEETRIWQSLPAVQAGRVHKVNIAWWNQSTGPISASRVLDDVDRAFGVAP